MAGMNKCVRSMSGGINDFTVVQVAAHLTVGRLRGAPEGNELRLPSFFTHTLLELCCQSHAYLESQTWHYSWRLHCWKHTPCQCLIFPYAHLVENAVYGLFALLEILGLNSLMNEMLETSFFRAHFYWNIYLFIYNALVGLFHSCVHSWVIDYGSTPDCQNF